MKFTSTSTTAAAAAAALIGASFVAGAADPGNLPAKTDPKHGQEGFNDCQKRYGASSQSAMCNNAYINSAKDFCLWAPHTRATIGESEERVVSWCTTSGYGTRLIPDGTLHSVHFLRTNTFVQVTGTGDFTKMNVVAGDEGGELDPHGATGAGNPKGGKVFTNAYGGEWQESHEWQSFQSFKEYCFRACIGTGATAKRYCPHIYDVMGCYWNEPANYDAGVFEDCQGTEGEPPGIYGTSTFYQGQKHTPPAHAPGQSSNCARYNTVQNAPASKTPTVGGAAKHAQATPNAKKHQQQHQLAPLALPIPAEVPALIKVVKRS